MAITNHERVGKVMELLKSGLAPFVDREFKNAYKDRAAAEASRFMGEDRLNVNRSITSWDAAALLKLMWDSWNDVFRKTLGPAERSLVSELRDHRNKWAHQQAFSSDDAYRAFDSAGRLLTAVSAPQADEIEKMKLLRLRFNEQVRGEKRKSAGTAIESQAAGNLKPWREVVTPHTDVASGRYQQAEFAADLWQVYLGEGTDEYRDPVEFFRRTYLTESLRRLLVGAVHRITGSGGDPVIQLQTNFGGGKTHSLCLPLSVSTTSARMRPPVLATCRAYRLPLRLIRRKTQRRYRTARRSTATIRRNSIIGAVSPMDRPRVLYPLNSCRRWPGAASAVHSAPAVRHGRRPADDPEQEALSLSCLPTVYD